MNDNGLTKVQISGTYTETPWATHIGEDIYILENIPFVNPDYALHDIVRCEPQEDSVFPLVVERIEGQNVTIMVTFGYLKESDQRRLVKQLDKLGTRGTGMVMPTDGAFHYSFSFFSDTVNAQLPMVMTYLKKYYPRLKRVESV